MAERTTIQLRHAEDIMRMLHELPAEVVSKRGGPVKLGLKRGALVILKQAQANLQASIAAPGKTAGEVESTGLLLKSLVASRAKPVPGTSGERYIVRVKRKSYKRAAELRAIGRKAKKEAAVTTLKTAQLLEYGSSQQQAQPWLRPAFASRAEEAIRVAEKATLDGLERAAKRLMRGAAK